MPKGIWEESGAGSAPLRGRGEKGGEGCAALPTGRGWELWCVVLWLVPQVNSQVNVEFVKEIKLEGEGNQTLCQQLLVLKQVTAFKLEFNREKLNCIFLPYSFSPIKPNTNSKNGKKPKQTNKSRDKLRWNQAENNSPVRLTVTLHLWYPPQWREGCDCTGREMVGTTSAAPVSARANLCQYLPNWHNCFCQNFLSTVFPPVPAGKIDSPEQD